jgi:hypothetical protein
VMWSMAGGSARVAVSDSINSSIITNSIVG